MDCTTVSELLPWLLNGTLDPEQRQDLDKHLAGCLSCRAGLGDVAESWELFASHPPPALLIAWAVREKTVDEEDLAEHVAQCSACNEEVGLIQQSQSLDAFVPPRTPDTIGAAALRWWRRAAIAATVVACASLGALVASRIGILGSPQLAERARTAQRQELRATTAKLEALAAEVERLSRVADELSLPRANLPVLELLPDSFTLRGGAAPLTAVPQSAAVTLILATRTEDVWERYRLRLLRADGSEIWRTDQLVRQSTDDFTLLLPTVTFEAGTLSLRLDGLHEGHWSELETFSLQVADPDKQPQ